MKFIPISCKFVWISVDFHGFFSQSQMHKNPRSLLQKNESFSSLFHITAFSILKKSISLWSKFYLQVWLIHPFRLMNFWPHNDNYRSHSVQLYEFSISCIYCSQYLLTMFHIYRQIVQHLFCWIRIRIRWRWWWMKKNERSKYFKVQKMNSILYITHKIVFELMISF